MQRAAAGRAMADNHLSHNVQVIAYTKLALVEISRGG